MVFQVERRARFEKQDEVKSFGCPFKVALPLQ
jgi:hypothetical protein